MALTIDQAQKLSEMRLRILANVQAGNPAHTGFSKEEITEGLSMIRQGKTASAVAAAEKGKKTKKAKAGGAPIDTKAFFGELDLDADDEEEGDAGATPAAN